MDQLRDLEIFLGDDVKSAELAFERLMNQQAKYVYSFLKRNFSSNSADDHEDMFQQMKINVWKSRKNIKNQGIAAWIKFLQRIAKNCGLDLLSGRSGPVDMDSRDLTDIPESEQRRVENIVTSLLSSEEEDDFHYWADLCFLKLNPKLSRTIHNRQLIAAKLYYLKSISWGEIIQVLYPSSEGENELNRSELDAWLSDPAVIRYLIYHELFIPCTEITAIILGIPNKSTHSELSELLEIAMEQSTTADPPAGWTWRDCAVVILRYRYAMLEKSILTHAKITISEKELTELCVRSDALLPFCNCMDKLITKFRQSSSTLGEQMAADRGVWQRLAFEYHFKEQIPHKDIHSYLNAPAAKVSYSLTLNMLNAWISNYRLLDTLAAYVQVHTEDLNND